MAAPYNRLYEADRLSQWEPIAGLAGTSGGRFETECLRRHDSQGTVHDLSASSPWPSWNRSDLEPPRPCSPSPQRRSLPEWPVETAALPEDLSEAQHIFERCQTELLLQSRRQDDVFNSIAKVEADLGRVARLAAENEGLHATERHQRHATLTILTRRAEDALLTCETLRQNQEYLVQKVERLEVLAEDGERAVEETRKLQQEVSALQAAVREKLDVYGEALRRLDAMEPVQEENARLRQEGSRFSSLVEKEMAAVQGQLDALTKLVKEQLREPSSPPPRSVWTPSPS